MLSRLLPSLTESLKILFIQTLIFVKPFSFLRLWILNNENITSIGNIFNTRTFNYIYIYDVPSLTSISNDAFDDSVDTLRGIDISDSGLTNDGIAGFSIKSFTKLDSIYFETSKLSSVPKIESDSLTTLSMQFGEISSIDTGKLFANFCQFIRII